MDSIIVVPFNLVLIIFVLIFIDIIGSIFAMYKLQYTKYEKLFLLFIFIKCVLYLFMMKII